MANDNSALLQAAQGENGGLLTLYSQAKNERDYYETQTEELTLELEEFEAYCGKLERALTGLCRLCENYGCVMCPGNGYVRGCEYWALDDARLEKECGV